MIVSPSTELDRALPDASEQGIELGWQTEAAMVDGLA